VNAPVETWNAAQCSDHWRIDEGRWRSYVSDGTAPKSLPGYDPDTGRKRWDAEAVRAALKARPGRGKRSTHRGTTDGSKS
jgi:hypothetical protein